MWPENETTDDLIGFQVHADLIRSVVLNPQMLPVTVGVFGDWGGGKTSIMRMLERRRSVLADRSASRHSVLFAGLSARDLRNGGWGDMLV